MSIPDDTWTRAQLAKACAGDLQAFGALVERHQGALRGFLALLGVAPDEVEELAQDVFVVAFGDLGSFDPTRDFGPWLRGIARHRVLQLGERRRRARRLTALESIADLLIHEPPPEPEETNYREHLAHLKACVEALPAAAAELVRLRYTEGWDSSRIASHRGQEPTTIRMALSRLRLALRRCVERRSGIGTA